MVHIGHCIINSDSGGGDFPGDPVGKTLLHNAEGAGSIPDWGARIPTCPLGQKNKTENRSNIVTNSIKTKKKKKSISKVFKKTAGKTEIPTPLPSLRGHWDQLLGPVLPTLHEVPRGWLTSRQQSRLWTGICPQRSNLGGGPQSRLCLSLPYGPLPKGAEPKALPG